MANSTDVPHEGAFEPTTLKVLTTVFDEVWAKIKPSLEGRPPTDVESVRSDIAHAVVLHAKNDTCDDVLALKSLTLQSLAQVYPQLRF